MCRLQRPTSCNRNSRRHSRTPATNLLFCHLKFTRHNYIHLCLELAAARTPSSRSVQCVFLWDVSERQIGLFLSFSTCFHQQLIPSAEHIGPVACLLAIRPQLLDRMPHCPLFLWMDIRLDLVNHDALPMTILLLSMELARVFSSLSLFSFCSTIQCLSNFLLSNLMTAT